MSESEGTKMLRKAMKDQCQDMQKEIESLHERLSNLLELHGGTVMLREQAESREKEWNRRAKLLWDELDKIPGNALGCFYEDYPDEPIYFPGDE